MSRNVMELIEKSSNCINRKYTMKASDITEILNKSQGAGDAVCNAFSFGYIQGMKATKAEMRNK